MEQKECHTCLTLKPITGFSKNRDRRRNQCYQCVKIRQYAIVKTEPNSIKCIDCKEEKQASKFGVRGTSKTGRDKICLDCRRTKTYSYRLKTQYDLSLDQYLLMIESINGICPICTESGHKLVVDHCHKTGKVRGLLCDICNRLLGHARDSKEILDRAKEYLSKC